MMININQLTRYQAAGRHFLLSLAIFFILLALMAYIWFPGKLFLYDGGLQGIKLLIIVDLVLGPALTLVVFNPKKKSLMLDLGCIFLIQAIALFWGTLQVYDARVQQVVYNPEGNYFQSIEAGELLGNKINALHLGHEEKPVPVVGWLTKPSLLSLSPPSSEEEKEYRAESEKFRAIFGAGGPASEYYFQVPYKDRPAQLEDSIGTYKLPSFLQESLKLTSHQSLHQYRFRYFNGYAIYDHEKREIVDHFPNKKISFIELLLTQ